MFPWPFLQFLFSVLFGVQSDELLDPEVTCGGTVECVDCVGSCQLSPETYAYGNKLFNVKDDPREEHDLYDQYPEVGTSMCIGEGLGSVPVWVTIYSGYPWGCVCGLFGSFCMGLGLRVGALYAERTLR